MTIANQRLMKNLTIAELERQRPDLVAAVKAQELATQGRLSGEFLNCLAQVAERIQQKNPTLGIVKALEQAESEVMANIPASKQAVEIPEDVAKRAQKLMAENPDLTYQAALNKVVDHV